MDRSAAPVVLLEAVPPVVDELAAVYRNYSAYVASIALRLLGRDDEVDDIVQDVFLIALRGIGKLREPNAVKGWLATVTVRLASQRLRRRRWRSLFFLDRPQPYDNIAVGANQEQAALIARLYRLLDELPVNQRIAWTLRNIEGEPLDAVATLCRCSLATAKRRIVAAQEAIDEAVGDE